MSWHLEAKVIDSGWTLRVCLLELDERVAIDLDVGRCQLPLWIGVADDFTKSELLAVVAQRLPDIGHAERDVIQSAAAGCAGACANVA
jgi:hypothetical protein